MPTSDSNDNNSVTTLDLTLKLAGADSKVKADEIFDFIVEADLDHPDMASVVLTNDKPQWSAEAHLGDELELIAGLAGKSAITIFKGEVTGIEPSYVAGGASRVTLRALNRLHRLSRGKKSKTYKNVSDSDLVNKVAQSNSLSVKFGAGTPSSPTFEHVYQHNQTDLEFVRLRAARLGYDVWVEDKTLHFEPRHKNESAVELSFGTTLEKFQPRLSTANQVSKVSVHGWDWNKKEAIVGSASSSDGVGLASKKGADVANQAFGEAPFLDVDLPVFTQDEATKIAKSIMRDRMMSYITGDGVCKGDPDIKVGIVVKVDLGDTRFNGKYYITAVRHRYSHGGQAGGFHTEFRFASDGAGS
ncbi:MAG: phage late control D family protein [Polyangia bacterium]|jgi:phage protein D